MTSQARTGQHRSRTVTRARTVRRSPAWVDRFLGSDPGQLRLRTALQAVATIAAAMGAEWVFVHYTHALQIDTHGAVLPPAQAALVAAQHHGLMVIAIMLGAIVGMMAAFGGALFGSPRQTLINFSLMPVPMIAGLAIGLAVADHRVIALALLVATLGGGAYLRRFGPSGFMGGQLVFMGSFFGFFLHAEVGLGDLGWLSAEIAIGGIVAVIAQFTMFYPSRRAALRRMLRSYAVRAREVTARAVELFDNPDDRDRTARSLHRRLVRLNETALLIDAQLGTPDAVPERWSAVELHQRLFDSELALTTVARLAERISEFDLEPELRQQVRDALTAVGELDVLRAEFAGRELLAQLRGRPVPASDGGAGIDRSAHIVLHRFAVSVVNFAEATQAWRSAVSTVSDASSAPFQPAVVAFGGWLPGSAMVSATASNEAGQRLRDRVTLQPYTRVAIQMTVAVTLAIVLGDILSGRRFYWAVIAAFVTFMGANNAGEQMRKGAFRIAGTVVGVFLGGLGAHLVGQRTGLAIVLILVSLFFGLYLMRISYAFMVIGITIMVSQLYVQLNEYSNSLLVLRLEETALGAAVAALTVIFVVPLRTGRVVRVAARNYLEALSGSVEAGVARMLEPSDDTDLRAATRLLDGAYQSLVTTMAPLNVPFSKQPDSYRTRLANGAAASRYYARNLLVDTASPGELTPEARERLLTASRRLVTSLGELVEGSRSGDFAQHTFVRSAGLFDLVAVSLGDDDLTAPRQLALRDLQLIDGAAAGLAQFAGLTVRALDTSGSLESPDANPDADIDFDVELGEASDAVGRHEAA